VTFIQHALPNVAIITAFAGDLFIWGRPARARLR